MENKENIFEKKQILEKLAVEETLETKDTVLETSKNYEQAEQELSSLFQDEKKKIAGLENDVILGDKARDIVFEKKIEDLMILAFTKSPEEAIKKASSYNDAFLLDEFHDLLIEELKKRKISN